MAIKLSDMQKRTRTITIKYKEDELDITYFVNAITPAFLSERFIVDQVKIAVSAWDVVDDDGKPLTVSESADNLSMDFLREVIDAILTDTRGGVGDVEKKD